MEPLILPEAEFWRSIQRTPAASQIGGVVLAEHLLVKGTVLPPGEDYRAVIAPYQAAGLYCVLVDTPGGYVLWHEPGTREHDLTPPATPQVAGPPPATASEPDALLVLAQTLRDGVEVKDRRYQFQTYPQSFVGSEAVEWLMRTQGLSRKQALALGQQLLTAGHIQRLDPPGGDFQAGNTFYRFTPATPSAVSGAADPEPAATASLDVTALYRQMVAQLPVQDRWYQFRRYPQSFSGAEAVEWLMRTQGLSRKQAVHVGQELLQLGLIAHSTGEHPFRDGNYFYRFAQTD